MERSRVENFEVEGRRRDGGSFWVSMNAHAVRNEAGAISLIEGTLVDISERKCIELERERLVQELQLAAANVKTCPGSQLAARLRSGCELSMIRCRRTGGGGR